MRERGRARESKRERERARASERERERAKKSERDAGVSLQMGVLYRRKDTTGIEMK